MAKYHLKEDGSPGLCSAEVRACPRGGEEQHYSSEEAAREAFEASMVSSLVPARRVKRSLMDRIKGRSEEEIYEEQITAELAAMKERLKYLIWSGSEVNESLEAASHYVCRREEALQLAQHAAVLQEKIRAIDDTGRALVKEHPKAFEGGLEKTSGYMSANRWNASEPASILTPGEDKAAHAQFLPMLSKLVSERAEAEADYKSLKEEANTLTSNIQREGNMSPDARAALSEATAALYAKAMSSDAALPAAEQVEDRRAWTQSRAAALNELEGRGII